MRLESEVLYDCELLIIVSYYNIIISIMNDHLLFLQMTWLPYQENQVK